MRMQMSAWLPVPLLLLACWGAPRGAEAYGNGAPPETCSSMTPGHGAAVASLGYSIDVSGTTFTNTSNLTVTVKGTYEGVIMQARAPGCSTPVGTWTTPPADTKVMQCSSASDTMTHSSETNKVSSVFTWISPKNGAPASVEFVATVAQNKDQWIKNIKSKAVTAQEPHFSTMGFIHSKLRNSLAPTIVEEKLVFIETNLPAAFYDYPVPDGPPEYDSSTDEEAA